ncbi:MAG: TetR/AcrR family transcriptional regulator [Mobilitalea sp.]
MLNNGKKSNRKEKADETKVKIYEAARQLFTDYGFGNVSVDSIVEAAGVSKGTFYVHFDTKDSLIVALMSEYVNKVDLAYQAHIDSFDIKTSVSEILVSLAVNIADVIINTFGHENMRTVYQIQLTKAIDTKEISSYNRKIYKMFNDIISRGIERGEFKSEITVDSLAKHLLVALRGLTYEWCIRYPDFDFREVTRTHFEILVSGIKK